MGRGYDKDFFNSKHRKELLFACVRPIVSSLIKEYNPGSVADLGCGDGIYIEEFLCKGIDVFGFDNSREGINRCKIRGINVKKFNIVKDEIGGRKKFDIAICFEVAEHIPAIHSEKIVRHLSKLSDIVIFTAAPPGQGGDNHINEQSKSFWIEKFKEYEYIFDVQNTEDLANNWRGSGVVNYMYNNLMIFKNKK